MKNKKKFAFLGLVLLSSMIISACGGAKTSDSSAIEQSQSSEQSIADTSSQQQGASSQQTDVSSQQQGNSSQQGGASSQGGVSSQQQTSSSQQQATSSQQQSSSQQTHSSQGASSSQEIVSTYTVTFVVDGTIVQTDQVDAGTFAEYRGETPSKASDGNVTYVFTGWDNDISQSIWQDTTFNAMFKEREYASEILVDDFENYSTASLKDAGWDAWGYNDSTGKWSTQTAASVSIGYNSVEGNKALRFDAWENSVGYKFVKTLQPGAFTKSANALRFRLMVPKINLVRVLLKGKVTIAGTEQAPSFSYDIHPTTNEYVEYTIPLADDGWALWDDPTRTIKSVADWTGVHEDDYLQYLTSIDFFIKGDDRPYGGNCYRYIAFLDSVKFVTLDNPQNTANETVFQYDRYTGTLADGTTVRIDLGANGQATARLIDLEVPQEIPGTYAINGKEMTFTSSDNGASLVYKGNITDAGKVVEYASATGAYASAVLDMNLNAVQVVENFEQYTESGVAYSQQNYDDTAGTGLRGAFYAEHWTGSGASDWGGDKWQLLPNGDEINLLTEGAHSGNKAASFKHMKNNAVRYMPWGLFKGQGDRNAFRGSKLGLWVKGFVDKLKVYMYSQTTPTAATKDERVKTADFALGRSIGEWQHIEVSLDPSFIYYGFMFLIEKDYISDAELLIDDIEVYTANPYATYVPPAEPEPKQLVPAMTFLGKINDMLCVNLSVKDESTVMLVTPAFGGAPMEGTYAVEDDDVTMNFGDVTYVATIADDYSKLTFKSIDGEGDAKPYLDNLSFTAVDFAESGEKYKDDGVMYYESNTDESAISGARGAYYCDRWVEGASSPLGGNNWGLMGGSGDQIKLDKTDGLDGQQCVTFKRSSGASLRYIQWDLYKGTAKERKGVDKFVVFLKNPAANELHLKLYVFKNKQVNPANQTERVEKELTLAANQDWTQVIVDLDPNTSYYGFGLYTYQGASNAYLKLDAAYFCGPDSDPNIRFFAKKDTTLSGITEQGPATIKFGTGAKAYLTCSKVNINNAEVKYSMEMTNEGQVMTIKYGDNTLKGIYNVDLDNLDVTFAITEATGQFAAFVSLGTTFIYQQQNYEKTNIRSNCS